MSRPAMDRAFTLIELLVVSAIIALLIAILGSSITWARGQARQVHCMSQLHTMSLSLMAYMTTHKDHLPWVEEPLWSNYARSGVLNWEADPDDATRWPTSFMVVMRPYLREKKTLSCSAAVLGMPRSNPWMNYRIAAANNYDGLSRHVEELTGPNGTVRYEYSLKYLNGRPYVVRHVDPTDIPWRLRPGPGPFYLVRDFIRRQTDGTFTPPHRRGFNQLFLDMHVERMVHPRSFSYP